jgi:serine/threonine protein kinase
LLLLIDTILHFLLQSKQIFKYVEILDDSRQGSQSMTTTRGQYLIGKEIGSCVLEKLLGYGGSSAVFLARSLTSDEQVAIKVFLPRSTLDVQMRKSFYRRFLREAEAASQLDHPHILSIYVYGEHDGMPYIVMPYMSGGTLLELVQRQGPLSLQTALGYLEQIGSALDYAHAHGCVHCDVKPANILLDGNGQTALSDFGIVHMVQVEGQTSPASKLAEKSPEVLMGTPDYVSPEQALGEELDGRSDVYSLGATLYYLLSGDPPFQAETPIALALMHVHETPTPLGMLRADVTPQIDLVLAQALAKWPEERFQSAGAFCSALAQAIAETEEGALQQTRSARKQATRNSAILPIVAQPIVQIKALKQPRFTFWRAGLALGLIAMLLLSCLLSARFIGRAYDTHPGTPTPQATPRSFHAPSDALIDNQQDWPTSSTFFFQNGRYYIQNNIQNTDPPHASFSRMALAFYANHQFANFHLSVVTTEIRGSYNSGDYYGIILRASADQTHYYLFEVMTWNGGQYRFLRFDETDHWSRLASGPTPGLFTQTGTLNVLSLEAQDNAFTFAINGKQLGKTVHDTFPVTLSSGGIGLVVEEPKTEVAFSQLSLTSQP